MLPVGPFLTPQSLVYESCLKLNRSDVHIGSLHIRFLFRRRRRFRVAWRLSQRRATPHRSCRGGVQAFTPESLAVRQNVPYHLERVAMGGVWSLPSWWGSQRQACPLR